MEITNGKSIIKYLNINMLSSSKSTYFESKKDKTKNRVKVFSVNSSKIIIEALDKPKYSDGFFIFQSYTFIFKANTKIHSENGENFYSFPIPNKIETFDQRKHIRLLFDHNERKTIHIFEDNLKKTVIATISDISAGGIGLIFEEEDLIPEIGGIIPIKVNLLGFGIDKLAKIINIHGKKSGCIFIEKSNKFQIALNHRILEEVEWRSETLLVQLKKLKKKKQEEDTEKEKIYNEQKQDYKFIEEFGQDFISEINKITSLDFKKDGLLFSEHTVPNFVSSVYLILKYNNKEFKVFFYIQDKIVYKIAKSVFKGKTIGFTVNANEILSEIGTKLSEGFNEFENYKFQISSPSVIQSNKRLMSFFYKNSSVKITFNSKLGESTLLLLPEKNKKN